MRDALLSEADRIVPELDARTWATDSNLDRLGGTAVWFHLDPSPMGSEAGQHVGVPTRILVWILDGKTSFAGECVERG
jgi:hypothetical protein